MNVNCTKLLMAVVACLCGAAAQAATLIWESQELSPSSMAFTPSHLLVLNDGEILPIDIATGCPEAPITAASISQIGNSDDGTVWACRYDTSSTSGPQIVLSTIAYDGIKGAEHVISTSQLDPAAYNGVKEHTFGPVTVVGSITDGSATVAFVEKIIANDQALTESLRLWRIYGIFDPSESPTARYSDLCVIDQYPYVTIFPDVNTQVVLATLTCSITDNSADVPYFYTSRSATQQAKQRLTTPVQPDASLTGISLATIGDDTYFLYTSKPGEVVLTQVGDPAEGFAVGNLQYVATLTMSATNAPASSKSEVCIATAAVDGQLAIALYTQGRALTLYRHGSGSNGVGDVPGTTPPPFSISGTAVTAFAPLEVYDLLGRIHLELAEGATGSLPAGTYVIRSGVDTQIVALR